MLRPVTHRLLLLARSALLGIVVVGMGGGGREALAVGLNYVDANDFTNLTPAAAIDSFGSTAEPDNLWDVRTDFGLGLNVFQAINEDAPQLTQKITGLMPGKSYDIYGVFVTDDDENWTLRAGVGPGSLTAYSFWGNRGPFPTANTTPGISAGAAVWDTLPPVNKEGTVFTERPADTLVNLLGKAGTITANASGEIDVLIDDLPNIAPNTGPRRTWLEGVAYTDAGTQIALNATLDRNTGAITIMNPTTTPFQVKGYSLVSTVGSLNATTWTTIAGWDTTAMPSTTADFATDLTQTDPAMTGTTIAPGGSLTFGNVWQKGPFEDVLIRLTRTDNEIAVMVPQYTGTAIGNGDFDANGAINLADFQVLLNGLHTTPGQPTRLQNYRLGELTGDNAINFSDWAVFRAAYDAANGAGAFEAMLAQVPEPSTLALLLISAASMLLRVRRRAAICGLAAALSVMSTNVDKSSAATLLKVDVDARAGDSTAGPPGNNTVDGFMPFTLDAGTTGAQPSATGTVGGYNIMLTAVTADGGTPANPGLDDRDRATPATAPTLSQLYDDFIFANVTNTGEGGGLDMSISGGALLPNTQYGVSIYSFDTGSVDPVRTSNWLDGNAGDALALTTSFDGDVNLPATDNQYRFNGVFRTDATGSLLLRARETATASHGVFINGFEITDELPVELTLQVNSTTGAVSIVNEQSVSFDVSYYEIRSAAGALNLAGWASLDDAEGGDPVGTGWDEAPASSSNVLSEVNLQSMRTLAPTNSVSLGNAFTPGGNQNLTFSYAGPTETTLHTGLVKFVTGPSGIAGDYNGNGRVDAADYVVWRKTDGTMTTLPNDLTPGTVDDDDYNVWRANFGKSAPASAALASGSTVPEPATIVFAVLSMSGGLQFLRKPRKRITNLN